MRFAADFRREEGYHLEFEPRSHNGRLFVELQLGDACEFMSKKDYIDNWQSEMHETFCFWSFVDWQQAVEHQGFRVLAGSRPITNPWIVENRYRGQVQLYQPLSDDLTPLDYPPTNLLLVAEKVTPTVFSE